MEMIEDLPDEVNYDLIEDGLYLGNLSTAVSISTLRKLDICHILTVASEPLPEFVAQQLPQLKFLYINVDDIPGSVLLYHFEASCKFIAEAQAAGGNVLVHCYFGVSRSATLVAAHLMKQYKLDAHEALSRIKAQRKCVGPNPGFLHQLHVFYAMKWTVDSYSVRAAPCRLYEHQMLCTRVRTEPYRIKEFLADYLEKFKSDPPVNNDPGLKCRSCKTVLCCKDSVLPHRRGCWPSLHTAHASREDAILGEGSFPKRNGCTSKELCVESHYMTAQPWMQRTPYLSKMAGSITCPKCSTTLGRYHWLRDLSCRCHENEPCLLCADADTARLSLTNVLAC